MIGAGRPVLRAVILAVALQSACLAGAAAQTKAELRADSTITVSVVVEGSLPGFRDDELAAYVSRQMEAAHVAAWHFAPADRPSADTRIVWRFRLLPYAGGSVRYIGPAVSRFKTLLGARRPIGVDARLYVGGQFQATTFDQATIHGSGSEPDLDAAIAKVTKEIVADALIEDPKSAARHTAFTLAPGEGVETPIRIGPIRIGPIRIGPIRIGSSS